MNAHHRSESLSLKRTEKEQANEKARILPSNSLLTKSREPFICNGLMGHKLVNLFADMFLPFWDVATTWSHPFCGPDRTCTSKNRRLSVHQTNGLQAPSHVTNLYTPRSTFILIRHRRRGVKIKKKLYIIVKLTN